YARSPHRRFTPLHRKSRDPPAPYHTLFALIAHQPSNRSPPWRPAAPVANGHAPSCARPADSPAPDHGHRHARYARRPGGHPPAARTAGNTPPPAPRLTGSRLPRPARAAPLLAEPLHAPRSGAPLPPAARTAGTTPPPAPRLTGSRLPRAARVAPLLAEPLHAPRSVDQLLPASEVRVAHRADLHVQHLHRAARLERVPARTLDRRHVVFRMDPLLHYRPPHLWI